MIDTDLLDQLSNAMKTEVELRKAAAIEWANGNKNGPMIQAHEDIVNQIIELARKIA